LGFRLNRSILNWNQKGIWNVCSLSV
jgi:hypothetical protein